MPEPREPMVPPPPVCACHGYSDERRCKLAYRRENLTFALVAAGVVLFLFALGFGLGGGR